MTPSARPPRSDWVETGVELGRLTEALTAVLAHGDELLLLSDYDGTLTPIVADPVEAWLGTAVRNDLRLLARSDRIRLGIVSGRRLEDLRIRVRLPDVIYAGCHGLQIDGPGIAFRHSRAVARRDVLEALAHAIRRRTAAMPGVVVEPKGLALVVHYRHAAALATPRLEAALARVIRPHRGQVRLVRGRKVIDVLPTAGWDKGQAVVRIRDHARATTQRDPVTVYLGDDASDELAFSALAGDAVTVRVGRAARTSATYRLREVSDVHRLLSALAAKVARSAA